MRRLDLVTTQGEVIPLDADPYHAHVDLSLSMLPGSQLSTSVVLGDAGSRVIDRRHTTRDVPVRITVVGDTPNAMDRAVTRLARAIDPLGGDVALRLTREDGTAREIVGTLVGAPSVGLHGGWAREATVPLILEAHEPYWRSTQESELDVLATEFIGGGEPTSFDARIPFDSAIPFDGYNSSGFQYFHLDMGGDVLAWPRFEVIGPGTMVTAVNITTGKLWHYVPAVAPDARFVVDARPGVRAVTLNDANVFSGLSDDSELWPLVMGRNYIGLRIQTWTAGRSSVLLSWRERYLTW